MNDNFQRQNHNFTCENRKNATLTGVVDVDAFTEEEIVCKTEYGKCSIKGAKLHVESLDLTSGNMTLTGEITAIVYSNETATKSFFRRMFD